MKKKIFLTFLATVVLICLMAVVVFAAEPNSNGEKVTLSDGTTLPIWDTDGDALIWYKSTANTTDGYANYDYVKAQSSQVDYKTNWAGGINGAHANQVGEINITVDGATYGKNDIVVLNIKDEDVVVTTSEHGSVGKSVNCVSGTFKDSKSIEYVYFKLDTVAIMANAFKDCSNLKYINFVELTKLNRIASQAFTGCASLLDGETLDLSNTIMTTLESGTFNNTPPKAIRFPETLKNLDSWSLQGLTKIKEINIPETITSFGETMFKNCYEVEKITGYKSLFDRGVITSIQSNTFLECRALKSIDLPETYTSIGGSAFKGTKSLSGTFKLSLKCTSIGSEAFHSTGYETIILNTKITTIPTYAFCASYVKNVYIPAGITVIEREAFRDVKNKMVIYFTGTDAAALKNVTVNNYNGVILDSSTICVSADKFDPSNKEEKHYIVYGYNLCDAFYDSEHITGEILNSCQFSCGRNCGEIAILENPQHQLSKVTTFGETGYFGASCTVESCSVCATVTLNATVGAIFVDYGYSMTEVEIGGKLSMSQFFGVNKENLAKYTDATGAAFEYGFVVSSNADPLNEANAGLIESGKTYVTTQDKFAHSYFVVTVSGFVTEGENVNTNKALTFCVYVKDGDSVSYLDNGETVETVEMKSYNDVKALLQNSENNNEEVTE